jgi:hypothetical protein
MTCVVSRADPRECLHRHLTVEKVDAAGVATTIRCVDCDYWWGDDEVWPIPHDLNKEANNG